MSAAAERDLEALAEALRRVTVAVRVAGGGCGAGVVWTSDGSIVTNAHVASRARAEVLLPDGRSLGARLIARDLRRDLALLRIEAADLAVPEVREPATLRAGELLVAVGHPYGAPNALALGVAHTDGRAGRRFIAADLRLAPGNSGGPLADVRGCVVGINSMVAAGLALAVPADEVARFVRAATAGARAA